MRKHARISWPDLSVALTLLLALSGCGGGAGTGTSTATTPQSPNIQGTWKLMSQASNGGAPTDMSATGLTIQIGASTATMTLPAAATVGGTTYAACTETASWTLNGNTLTITVTASPVAGSVCDPVGTVTTGTVSVNGSTMTMILSTGVVNTYSLQTGTNTGATAGTTWNITNIAGFNIPQLRIARNLNGQWVAAGFSTLLTMTGSTINNTITIPTTGWIYGAAYGNGTYVGVGSSNTIITSPNAINWTARVSTFSSFVGIESVAFGNGRFVAVSGSANNSWSLPTDQIQTSADGITWTAVNMAAHSLTVAGLTYPPGIASVTFGNGQFVAVGNDGATWDAAIFTSTDGLTWSRQNTGLPAGNLTRPTSVKFAGGQYVAVGQSGLILTSPDGVVWTKRTAVTPNVLRDVAYGNGKYIAVGDTGTMIESSDGGITWTALPALTTYLLNSIDFANNQFVVVGDWIIITSP